MCKTHFPLLIKTLTSSSKSILGSWVFWVINGEDVDEACSFPNESSNGALQREDSVIFYKYIYI